MIAGDRFGRWVVLQSKLPRKRALVRCDCGNEREVRRDQLTQQRSRSCGCLKLELFSRRFISHGQTNSREYNAWKLLKQRCLNPKNPEFRNYGARGIKVCERWLSFESFLEDMGKSPSGREIERIDNNSDYSPENCRWATSQEQKENRRNTLLVDYGMDRLPLSRFCRVLGIPYEHGYRLMEKNILQRVS